jgi:hypothetical protein
MPSLLWDNITHDHAYKNRDCAKHHYEQILAARLFILDHA